MPCLHFGIIVMWLTEADCTFLAQRLNFAISYETHQWDDSWHHNGFIRHIKVSNVELPPRIQPFFILLHVMLGWDATSLIFHIRRWSWSLSTSPLLSSSVWHAEDHERSRAGRTLSSRRSLFHYLAGVSSAMAPRLVWTGWKRSELAACEHTLCGLEAAYRRSVTYPSSYERATSTTPLI